MKRLAFTICFMLFSLSLHAFDWGLLVDQTVGVESLGADVGGSLDLSYTGTVIPWVLTPLGAAGNLYLSAGASLEYESEELYFVPQLLRTEFSYRFGGMKEIKIGRMLYSDPLGFIANGLFDGARVSLDAGKRGSMGIGLWYTGLLYKRNAQITMTGEDLGSYHEALDYSRFADTYFAPRRIIAALDWNYPDMTEWLRFKMALMGQFDLNGRDESYNSQYLVAKASVPVRNFVFDFGACMQFAEIVSDDTRFKLGFAGELAAGWATPLPIRDRLLLTVRMSTGTVDNDSIFASFVPVTTDPQGDILKAKLSGLSMLRLDYTARLNQNILVSIANSYFILSDLNTYQSQGLLSGTDGHFLGNEICGKLMWSPVSDLRFNFGAGVFLPSLGNTESSHDPIWHLELNAILTIF